MDRDEALRLLGGGRKGVAEWNRRREAGEVIPDLSGADLSLAHLTGARLSAADLSGADLDEADLSGADLSGADLTGARLDGAHLSAADLTAADLTAAILRGADLTGARLSEAYLSEAHLDGAHLAAADLDGAHLDGAHLDGADLSGADLDGAHLDGAHLDGASCGGTSFGDVDLSGARGLDSVVHLGPSRLSTDTLIRSRGLIPEAFLRGCGLPDNWIEYLPSLIHGLQPIQFYSCFISYSSNDGDFATRLHSRMVQEKLRVWFAPEDMKAGRKIHEQLDQAIRVHDKLLLVLSPHSIGSNWVRDEVRRARKAEVRDGRRKLFPVRLMAYEALASWQSFYADLGEDLAEEVRAYFIPDFTAWKDHDAFEAAFARLLRDLKAEDKPGA